MTKEKTPINNINPKPTLVNLFSKEKIKIIKDYLLLHDQLKEFNGGRVHKCETGYESQFLLEERQEADSCPLGVPGEFRLKSKKINRKGQKRKPPELKYPELAEEARTGIISDKTIVETYKKRMKERPLLFFTNQQGDSSVFYGKTKGCPIYNAMLTDRINSASDMLTKNYSAFYFLTFTYEYNKYGTDIIKAWKLFNNQLSLLFKALRRTYKMGYVCVLEATKKGYPHAHVILGINHYLENWHSSIPDGKKIESGTMYEYLKGKVASPVFSLQKAGGKGLVKYLGKYVSKSADSFIGEYDSSKQRLTSKARKSLLSCLLPVLAEVRQYRFSIRDNVINSYSLESFEDEDFIKLKNLVQLGWTTPEGDSTLIRLLNKLTTLCHSRTWAIFNNISKTNAEDKIGYYSTAPPEIIDLFLEQGYSMGCPGCIITNFLYNLKSTKGDYLPLPGKEYAKIIQISRTAKFEPINTFTSHPRQGGRFGKLI